MRSEKRSILQFYLIIYERVLALGQFYQDT